MTGDALGGRVHGLPVFKVATVQTFFREGDDVVDGVEATGAFGHHEVGGLGGRGSGELF